MNDVHLSILDYFKKKYNIENLENMVSLFYLSLLCSIIIYLSTHFEVIQMTFVIFVVLLFSMYLINQYYKKKYEVQMETITEKVKYISELISKISDKQAS
jgi:Flp pilus assembly protein TadB